MNIKEKVKLDFLEKLRNARTGYRSNLTTAELLDTIELPKHSVWPLITRIDLDFQVEHLEGSIQKEILVPILDAGFELSWKDTYGKTTRFVFTLNGGVALSVSVFGENDNCRYVKTGRVIEELELVCDD